MTPKRVLYFTNIAPHYRSRLWLVLAGEHSLRVDFFFGKPGKSGIKEINFLDKEWEPYTDRIHYIKNIRLRDIIFWQRGVIITCLKTGDHALIFLGQYHILSNWIAAVLARLGGKHVIFWGHGFYSTSKGIKKWVRKVFYSLADDHLVYSHRARELMIREGFNHNRIHIVYNSLDYAQHRQLRQKSIIPGFYRTTNYFKQEGLPTLIFIGRLTQKKRIDLLIKAVSKLNAGAPKVNLVIIGKGPVERSLQEFAAPIRENCYFYGESYDEAVNGRLIANADLCVSPGDVGLTAIHSLSFGTPVCTHGNMAQQMPEAEAIKEGITGIFFKQNKELDLAEKINEWLALKKDREKVREACYQVVDEKYNPFNQLSVFKKVLQQD